MLQLVFVLDENNNFVDVQFWKEETNKLVADFENFKEIVIPETKNYFEMMENFVSD